MSDIIFLGVYKTIHGTKCICLVDIFMSSLKAQHSAAACVNVITHQWLLVDIE